MRISTHGDKLALISRLLGTAWMNAVINIPCWFGNAVIYFNNLPDGTGLLNDFALFIYILPCAAAACPQIPSDSLKPREQGSHFYQWEDPESADSEGLAGGSGREAGRKWKRAPGLAVFNWVQAGPSTRTAISPDLCRALFYGGWWFEKGQEDDESWASCPEVREQSGNEVKRESCLSQNFKLGLT